MSQSLGDRFEIGMTQAHFPPKHRIIVDRFLAACQTDDRVMAAFLGGSYASGTADAHSDLDLYLITTDEAYVEFLAERETLVRRLGEPLFLEDWGNPNCYFFILADGTEGELWIGQQSHFKQIHGGAHTVLLDKQGILTGIDFPLHEADPTEQTETLRQLIMSFWHEVGHFNKALARNQVWFAYGSLETMRHICVNLARLRHNFADEGVGEEPFFKIEHAMPVEQLAPLQATFCPLEIEAIRQAGAILLQFYGEVAAALAERHGLIYPAALEKVMRVQ
ncbi:MAG: aminoglycoside 6-adenylyltransferase [Caldilineaceae bacterium]